MAKEEKLRVIKGQIQKNFEHDGLTTPFENKLIFQNNRKVKTEGSKLRMA